MPAAFLSHTERILAFTACLWQFPPLRPHLEAARALAGVLIPLVLRHWHGGMRVSYAGISLRVAGRLWLSS